MLLRIPRGAVGRVRGRLRGALQAPRRVGRLGAALAFSLVLGPISGASTGASANISPGPAASTDLRELQEWLDARNRRPDTPMPFEARLAYRRGILAWRSGESALGVTLVRGASALDPSFLPTHMTLVSWYLTREPSQALVSCAALLRAMKADFRLQLESVANALFFGLHALFWGLIATALLIVFLRQQELRHLWSERLASWVSVRSARVWSWVFLLAPWGLGLGLAVPALVFLGLLWPTLKVRERLATAMLAVAVAGAPLAPGLIGRLALPLHSGAPYYGVLGLDREPIRSETVNTLAALAERHPESAYVHFGLGWAAGRQGNMEVAEAAYRRVLDLWPSDARALNNLGNLMAARGRFREALEQYGRAAEAEPRFAAPLFNAAQVHTQLFDYPAASDALAQASELDFEMVKAYQIPAAFRGNLPLVDEWIAPATSWAALMRAPPAIVPRSLPPAWRRMVETSGWPFTIAALTLVLASLLTGLWWHRALPLRSCSNCGTAVCRRCAKRQREQALCPACAAVAAQSESPEFGRVLLNRERRRVERTRSIVRVAVGALLPGFAPLLRGRMLGGLGILGVGALLVSLRLGVRVPFTGTGADVAMASQGSEWAELALWVLLYAASLAALASRTVDSEAAASKPAPGRRGGQVADLSRAA